MPTLLDLVFVTLLAVAWPLYEHSVDWPRFQRWLRDEPSRARTREYRATLAAQWLTTAAGAALWMRGDRPWSGLRLVLPGGWRLWS